MTPKALAKKIALHAFEKKAADLTLIDMRKVSDVTDFFLICSADSDVQVKAISDSIEDGLAERGLQPWHREGLTQRQWVLLDFVDVVVHIFHKDVRKFYALEKLWGDAKIEELVEENGIVTARARSPKKRPAPKKLPASKKSPASKKPAALRTKKAAAADASKPKARKPAAKKPAGKKSGQKKSGPKKSGPKISASGKSAPKKSTPGRQAASGRKS